MRNSVYLYRVLEATSWWNWKKQPKLKNACNRWS